MRPSLRWGGHDGGYRGTSHTGQSRCVRLRGSCGGLDSGRMPAKLTWRVDMLKVFVALMAMLLVACGSQTAPVPQVQPTAPTPDIQATIAAGIAATMTAAPTATPIPTIAPTATPTLTPAPTLTNTPTPTPTVSPRIAALVDLYQRTAALSLSEARRNVFQPTYNSLARSPDSYTEKPVVFMGEVLSTAEMDSGGQLLRVEVIGGGDLRLDYSGPRLLESDEIEFVAIVYGDWTYKTVLGAERTIPHLVATHVQLR